jgi:hypothetical protein
MLVFHKDNQPSTDLDLAPGVLNNDNGDFFKVRVSRGLKLGAVLNLSPLDYFLAKGESTLPGASNHPRYEPVPDNCPLQGPILPPNLPTDMADARQQAARGLKKEEKEITFAEIVKFFSKRQKNQFEIFGCSQVGTQAA